MDIITKTPIMTNYFAGNLFLIAVIAFLILIIPALLLDISSEFCMTTLLVFIASLLIGWLAPVDYTGKNEYLVRIDDTVSFNEVIDKYEIIKIDEENGTVTLKDKEPINNAE